ncbi:MAG: hypothetical protein DRP87_10090 [Spirochaetes bacterium]|nr:MAG: hypothetical protein DRP87_10090 [Spirochaetota bacterium]
MRKVVPSGRLLKDFCNLSVKILRFANKGISHQEFLREVLRMIIEFSGCDSVEIKIENGSYWVCWEASRQKKGELKFKKYLTEILPGQFSHQLLQGHFDPNAPNFTELGSFWTGDGKVPVVFISERDGKQKEYSLGLEGYRSLLFIPLTLEEGGRGFLELKSEKVNFFRKYEIEFYEGVAQTLSEAFSDQKAQAALRERVKELSCLYGIAKIIQRPGISIEDILSQIVEILPPAFQFPEQTAARIRMDEHEYRTANFKETPLALYSEIVVNGSRRGMVEVVYLAERFEFEENPFLQEEQHLIDGVAKQISLIIEGKKAEEERRKLEGQLRHADRLATIGELSAGVAHELNEPLGNILGFAQLIKKDSGLSEQTIKDLEKIEGASLHAREVVKKLLLFARQMPTRKTRLNLNDVVKEGLYFLESRCAKEGIKLKTDLSENLPEIEADPSQIQQVLVNLVVNAVQSMKHGGRLDVVTRASSTYVALIVSDTGPGMSEDIKRQIFLPFFTTKEVGHGTGLGLAVVHGIVSSHGGDIKVESEEGKGATFEIRLPRAGL